MQDRKRRNALFLCVGLILVLLSSAAYIIHEADHDCAGEDCPVCQMIAVHLSVLHLSILAILATSAIRTLPKLYRSRDKAEQAAFPFFGTLVSLKIRLND